MTDPAKARAGEYRPAPRPATTTRGTIFQRRRADHAGSAGSGWRDSWVEKWSRMPAWNSGRSRRNRNADFGANRREKTDGPVYDRSTRPTGVRGVDGGSAPLGRCRLSRHLRRGWLRRQYLNGQPIWDDDTAALTLRPATPEEAAYYQARVCEAIERATTRRVRGCPASWSPASQPQRSGLAAHERPRQYRAATPRPAAAHPHGLSSERETAGDHRVIPRRRGDAVALDRGRSPVLPNRARTLPRRCRGLAAAPSIQNPRLSV
jgi:hypothetical protein